MMASLVLTGLTCLGVLHADASVAVETRWAAAADVADVRRAAVDALDAGEAGTAGAGRRHGHSRGQSRA